MPMLIFVGQVLKENEYCWTRITIETVPEEQEEIMNIQA